MNIKEAIYQQYKQVPVENFHSFNTLLKLREYENKYRKLLSDNQIKNFSELELLGLEYITQKEFEIIEFTLDVLKSILN